MSYYDDYIADHYFDVEEYYLKIQKEAESGIWTTKDGRRIAIIDMTDSHLINTYRMLERNDTMDVYLPWLAAMQKEIINRNIDYEFKDKFSY